MKARIKRNFYDRIKTNPDGSKVLRVKDTQIDESEDRIMELFMKGLVEILPTSGMSQSEIDAKIKALQDQIPKKVSDLTDDVDIAKKSDIPVMPIVPKKVSDLTDDLGLAKKTDIPIIPEIPIVPKKVSELTDDIGLAKKTEIPSIPDLVNPDWQESNMDRPAYIRNKPAISKPVIYSGTTNAQGNYAVTYPAAYINVPTVLPTLPNQANANLRVTVAASSKTGFTINVKDGVSATVLGIPILKADLIPAPGIPVEVTVIDR